MVQNKKGCETKLYNNPTPVQGDNAHDIGGVARGMEMSTAVKKKQDHHCWRKEIQGLISTSVQEGKMRR